MLPSLFIWPIRTTGTPLVFANRNRAEAHSRTWVTLPGLLSTSSVDIVCIESTTTSSGFTSLMCSNMCSREVSDKMMIFSGISLVMRSARIRIWCGLSSPLTYKMRWDRWRMVCKVNVLLPIPGSPPNKTMLPGTRPPPNTRFNSPSCMSIRGSSFAETSRSLWGLLANPDTAPTATPWRKEVAAWRAACVPVSAEIRISLNVFHCPQLGHLPIHFALSCPQLLQT